MKIIKHLNDSWFVGNFGIKYLDDKLSGILSGDLVLLGARSGAGKSTIAEKIAQHNSSNGKKVLLFSLENFEGDAFVAKCFNIYRRITRNYNLKQRIFSSKEFLSSPECDIRALEDANAEAEKFFENIIMVNRQNGFTLSDLKEKMIKVVNENDVRLIIIDHLDYLDKDNINETDVSFVTEIMRTIRKLQDEFKVGVVAISHLRKLNGGANAPIIPSVDEFIGSGNKVKESTVVIMFSIDEEEYIDDHLSPTWCSIQKLRKGGIERKKGYLFFDKKSGSYSDDYQEYIFKGGKKELVQ